MRVEMGKGRAKIEMDKVRDEKSGRGNGWRKGWSMQRGKKLRKRIEKWMK